MDVGKAILATLIFIVGIPLAMVIGAAGLAPILEIVIMLVATMGFFILIIGGPIAIIYFVLKFLAEAWDNFGTYTNND